MNTRKGSLACLLCTALVFVQTNASTIAARETDPAEEVQVETVPPSHLWRITAGAYYRSFDRVRFRTGSYADISAIPGGRPGDTTVDLAPVGDATTFANRDYDDGFVNTDPGTPNGGDTWYWGYDDAGQVGNDTLTFHRELGVQQDGYFSEIQTPGGWTEDSPDGLGFIVEAERTFRRWCGVDVGILANLNWTSLDVDHSLSTYAAEVRRDRDTVTVTDTYDLMGIQPPPPGYAGTYNGPGPLLPNRPLTRSVLATGAGGDGADYFNRIVESMDVDLLTLGIGVTGTVEYDRLGISLAAGPTLNLVILDAAYHETLFRNSGGADTLVEEWRVCESDTEIGVGVFCQAAVNLAVTGQLRVGVFGRYDWIDAVDGTVGPAGYDADLSGLSAGALLGWVH